MKNSLIRSRFCSDITQIKEAYEHLCTWCSREDLHVYEVERSKFTVTDTSKKELTMST